jgi:molybdate transport system substrate-binding protein
MKIRSIVILLALFISAIAGCQTNSTETANKSSSVSENLTISAAVSLKDAFNEIGKIYKSKTGKNANFNFGASGTLQKQIETGAPVDIFASAGETQMDALVSKNLIDAETRRDFARNALVLIVPQNSTLNLTAFSGLSDSSVKKIAVGNPKTVPAGQYTEQLFEKSNLKNSVREKLILAEDVRQVLDYVVRGETDAGIVYASDAGNAGEKVRVVSTAPVDAHDPILYPIAIIKDSKNKQSAEVFIKLVAGAEGQAILQKYGFAGLDGK